METSAGELLKRFARSPDGRNWRTCSQRSRDSPWQFHSSFRQEAGNSRRRDIHEPGMYRPIAESQSRFCLMNLIFHDGKTSLSLRA